MTGVVRRLFTDNDEADRFFTKCASWLTGKYGRDSVKRLLTNEILEMYEQHIKDPPISEIIVYDLCGFQADDWSYVSLFYRMSSSKEQFYQRIIVTVSNDTVAYDMLSEIK